MAYWGELRLPLRSLETAPFPSKTEWEAFEPIRDPMMKLKTAAGKLMVGLAILILASGTASAQSAQEVWANTKASESIAILETFIEIFPDSVYAKLARARVDELKAERTEREELAAEANQQEPQPAAPAEVAVVPPQAEPQQPLVQDNQPRFANEGELIRAVQTSLKKHRCYTARVDGKWGRGSRAAVRRFNEATGTQFQEQPSEDLYYTARGTPVPACPLVCGPRYNRSGDECVLKTCPPGQRLSRNGKCVQPVARLSCERWNQRPDARGTYIVRGVCYYPVEAYPYTGCPPAPPREFRHCPYRVEAY